MTGERRQAATESEWQTESESESEWETESETEAESQLESLLQESPGKAAHANVMTADPIVSCAICFKKFYPLHWVCDNCKAFGLCEACHTQNPLVSKWHPRSPPPAGCAGASAAGRAARGGGAGSALNEEVRFRMGI
jgi:hypothetical protein